MLQNLLTCILLFLIVSCGNTVEKPLSRDFSSIFEEYAQIELDTNFVYDIRFLDVNSKGDLLISNRRSREVLLLDSLGKFKTTLSEELDKGFPGANWAPFKPYFTANDEIFVSNGAPWGIWFNKDGSFKKMMPREYRGTPDLAFDGDDNIYSLNKNQLGFFIAKYDSNGKQIRRFTNIDSTYRTVMRRIVIGNNITVIDDRLFYKNIGGTNIYKYDLNGNLTQTYSETPVYYKKPIEDIPSFSKSGPQRLSQNIDDFTENYTSNYSIHSLDSNLILIQYINRYEGYGHQILTTKGDYVMDVDLQSLNKIYAARNGFVYTATSHDNGSATVNVFRYKH